MVVRLIGHLSDNFSRVPAPELVIFDCDGVLVDSERLSAEVSSELLGSLGWQVTPDELLTLFAGCTEEYWASQVELRTGHRVGADWDERYRHRYDEAFRARLRPVPGVPEVLAELQVAFCVASNGPRARVRSNLELVGLLHHFDAALFSAQDVARGKPAPDLFLHAAATMGTEPSRCVVVEDSVPGVQAARAAGMRCLAYVGDYVSPDRLQGPDTTLFSSMAELPALLAGTH